MRSFEPFSCHPQDVLDEFLMHPPRAASVAEQEQIVRMLLSSRASATTTDFPKELSGPAFISAAEVWLKPVKQFCAFALRLDSPAADGEAAAKARLRQLMELVRPVIDSANGFWGLLNSTEVAGFIADQNAPQLLERLTAIQQQYQERTGATVSAGVALFPQINYPKDQIMDNTGKALAHAAFFGPGAAVIFDAISLNVSGDQYYAAGDVEGAMREFKNALLIDPANSNVHNSLGVCHAVSKAWEPAMEAFATAAWLAPGDAMPLYNIGLVHLLKEDTDEALKIFLQAWEVDQEVFELALRIGSLYNARSDFEKSRPFLEKAVNLRATSGPAHRFLGHCYEALGLRAQAIRMLQKAVKINPGDAESLSLLGYLFDCEGENIEIATLFCRQSVELAPDVGLFHGRLAHLLEKQNQLAEALAVYQKARDLGGDHGARISALASRLAIATE